MVEEIEPHNPKKYCMCAKTTTIHFRPGTRVLPHLMPYKAIHEDCVGNHTCVVVGDSIHIKN